jgi:hypothetical protein
VSDKGEILKQPYSGKLRGARFAFAGMNFMVDPADLPVTEGQCVDILNCDVDYKNNISRRPGYTQVLAGDFTNAWSNNDYTYCVTSGTLCYVVFSPQPAVFAITGVPELHGNVEFKQVNDVVAFSDGITMGILDGLGATIINKPVFQL